MMQHGVRNNTGAQTSLNMYRKIIVALDGSTASEKVLPHVIALAQKFGSEVTLLRATLTPAAVMSTTTPSTMSTVGPLVGPASVPPAIDDPQAIIEAQQREAQDYLQRLSDNFHAQNLMVRYETQQGSAPEVILEHARQTQADLIAMTTHGHSGLGRLVLGSVADEVIRNAPCPVLLIRVSE
jgi:nucleotide-binding universal stress UspA family protein